MICPSSVPTSRANVRGLRSWLPGLALLTLLAFSATASAQQNNQTGDAMAVKVDAVRTEPMRQTVPVIGRFVAKQSGVVAARVNGAIGEIRVEVGDRVATGDVIAVLVRDRLRWERNLQSAEVATNSAQVETKEAETKLLQQELARLESLKKSPAFSQAKLDDKKQEIIVAQSGASEADARLRKARANLKLTEIDLADAEIKAPYGGIVSQKHTAVGAYVTTGNPVVTLIDDRTLEIEADVPSVRVSALEAGVVLDAVQEGAEGFSVAVRAVVPEENPQTRTRAVRFTPTLPETAESRAVNQSVTLLLPAGRSRDVLTVHKDAVINRRGVRLVVIADGAKARFRPVTLGDAVGTRFVVEKGLKEGELVIIRGNERLRPDQAIRYEGMPEASKESVPQAAKGDAKGES